MYSEDQIKEFVENTKLFEPLEEVLELLEKSGELSMKDIGDRAKVSIYPRDKAILALEFAGFIKKVERKRSKIYSITDAGKRLLTEIQKGGSGNE